MKTDKSKHLALAGIFLLLIGVVLFAQKLGAIFPSWLFSWEMIVIVLGLYIGLKRNFKGVAWFILISIGGIYMLDDIYPFYNIFEYSWPVIIILFGILLIIKSMSKKEEKSNKWENCTKEENISEDVLNSVTIFSGVRKVILSKNFKGGEIVSFMGGAEINLTQADIQGKVQINISQVFSGVKIKVPPHWLVQSEMVSVMGGFDDKRPKGQNIVDPEKVLVIKGTNLLGGIEVKSY